MDGRSAAMCFIRRLAALAHRSSAHEPNSAYPVAGVIWPMKPGSRSAPGCRKIRNSVPNLWKACGRRTCRSLTDAETRNAGLGEQPGSGCLEAAEVSRARRASDEPRFPGAVVQSPPTAWSRGRSTAARGNGGTR